MRHTLFLLFVWSTLLSAFAQQKGSYFYQILYTGRTLGYARVPDEQTLPRTSGPDSEVASEFLRQFALATNSQIPQFRIAMGDNFSPDLYGRSMRVDKSIKVPSCGYTPSGVYSDAIHLPKDYFTFLDHHWYMWCSSTPLAVPGSPLHFFDNVADFLIKAQYDAVVPGKHDFYFGPQYLRQIASYLEGSCEHAVHMLGANIIISSSVPPGPLNIYPRIPERIADACHYNTGRDHDCYHANFGPASLDLPDNILPWKRQFVLHGARRAVIKGTAELFRSDELKNFKDIAVDYTDVFDPQSVEICAEPGPMTNGDPAKAVIGNPCTHRMHLVASDKACVAAARGPLKSACKALYKDSEGIYDPKKQSASTDMTFLFENPDDHLFAGLNHMFCVKPNAAANPPGNLNLGGFLPTFNNDATNRICQPFPVQIPMFWPEPKANLSAPLGMSSCKGSSLPCPYALIERMHQKVAIFAVVDADLLSNVGMLNAGWINHNHHWDTAAQITAPDYALLQTLELCNVDQDCRKAPKILMAQMSYARARQLISNSQFSGVFDAVLTQASAEHDSGIVETKYQGNTPRFALTPPDPISSESIEDSRTQDATRVPGGRLSRPVFVPQVYAATITKSPAPEKPADSPDARAAVFSGIASPATCRPNPKYRAGLPPPISSLPGAPKLHDFGPCWSLYNTSIALEMAATSGASLHWDAGKLPLYRPPRFFCPAAQEKTDQCLDLKHLAEGYLGRKNTNVQAQFITYLAASDPLTQAVLVAMRDALKTDAAMIQTRDLYDADSQSMEAIDKSEVQDQISRIVWKGDEAIVIHVTGATIRKLLKQSAAFAQLEKNSLNTEIEKGRDLVTLGIYPDPKDPDNYYINGAAMSDTALYSIATTDFISGGDTGYSNLVPPDVLPPYRIRDFAALRVQPIAGLLCEEIARFARGGAAPCAPLEVGAGYFDTSYQSPNDTTAGYDTAQRYKPEGFFGNFRRLLMPPRRPLPTSEQDVQQRPFFYVNLGNLDFSESGAFIDHFSRTIPRLAGITNPLVANKGNQNIGADHKVRAVFDYQAGTAYFQSDSSFLYSNIVSYTPPSPASAFPTQQVVNGPAALTYNILGFEGGGTFRLSRNKNTIGLQPQTTPRFGRPSWLSLQYSVRYERELTHPINTQAALTPPTAIQDTAAPFVSNLELQTPRLTTTYYRGGLRAENNDTYLEIGLEDIDSRHLLAGYTITQPGGTITCSPTAMMFSISCNVPATLSFAVPPTAQIVPPSSLMLAGPINMLVPAMTYSKRDPGAYLNFYWKFPLWSRRDANRVDQSWYFTLTNKGDVYFNRPGDTIVQTRYLDKFTPALNFPLWAGLAFTPKVDFILYQNKIQGTPFWAAQPTFALSYTFLWRQGMGFPRALRYGAQTTTPSPAGTTH